MSVHATPFLVINLGCEIIYVIDQRLRAQNITPDKSEKVLMDVTSVLLNDKLCEELFAPQPVSGHVVLKRLLLDISSSSIMRLDDYSAGKLWELATMIFKWQLATATANGDQNIFDITRRHLRGVAALLPPNYPCAIFDRTRKKFDTLGGKMSTIDYENLNCALLTWLSDYKTKISVLLRLGLQNKDGKFILPSPANTIFIKNLGDNIYVFDTKNEINDISVDTSEISCLLSQIATTSRSTEVDNSIVELKLPLFFENSTKNKVLSIDKNIKFENIAIVRNVVDDLSFDHNLPNSTQEDLLKMLEND